MRDIKYRGIRLDNNEWVYGGIWFFNTATRESVCIVDDGDDYAVDVKTVGQYTGLKDCKGAEIYEGDIVKEFYTNPITDKEAKKEYVIAYEDGCFKAHHLTKHPYGTTFLYFLIAKQLAVKTKIIGNIHENPELLETNSTTRD